LVKFALNEYAKELATCTNRFWTTQKQMKKYVNGLTVVKKNLKVGILM